MTENIITQVTPDSYSSAAVGYDDSNNSIDYNSKIHLNIRGTEFTITRDELMSLPESILLCLFPNGVFLDVNGQVITNLTEDDIVYVNFEPSCFQYIIDQFSDAQRDLLEMPAVSPQTSFHATRHQENVLQSKPAIIVLREDLDYYVIPPIAGLNAEQMKHLKLEVSTKLIQNKYIFSGLGYDVHEVPEKDQKLGPAEQHLFDMLCSSGFDSRGLWGSRSLEPSKCVILSLLLVRLKTHPPTPPESPSLLPTNTNTLSPVTSNASARSRSRSRIASLANSATRAASRSLSKSRKPVDNNQTKLLLFWRKPARKCWWSNESAEVSLEVPDLFAPDTKLLNVKIHIRRVWTLELSVIGVQ